MYDSIDAFVYEHGGRKAIKSILIANNGIAAVKCIRSVRQFCYENFCDERAISFVAMATPEDMKINAEYIKMADQYVAVPGGSNNHNYANVELILDVAQRTKVDAVWAGWGHASENPKLPTLLKRHGIVFIGPQARAMHALGDKISSTIIAQNANVPCLPWSGRDVVLDTTNRLVDIPKVIYDQATIGSEQQGLAMADTIGYPIMIKASEGGGGKGIRKVEAPADFIDNFRRVQAEVPGSPIFLMKLAGHSRHLEVQLLADEHGNVVSLYGRDCSVQRRHQKIIEEAPAIAADPYTVALPAKNSKNIKNNKIINNPEKTEKTEKNGKSAKKNTSGQEAVGPTASPVFLEMEKAAVRLAKSVGYVNAGTVEYLFCNGEYFFLELNPRLQVEHPCTEMVSGINLPAAQVQVSMGIPLHNISDVATLFNCDKHDNRLELEQREPPLGHVMACRITAENPDEGFKPTSGNVLELNFKSSRNVWGYFSVNASGGLHEFADSQFGHIFSFGKTRDIARKNMVVTLKEINIRGEFRTTTEYLIKLLEMSDFIQNNIDTTWLDSLLALQAPNLSSAASNTSPSTHNLYQLDQAVELGLICAAARLGHLQIMCDESIILKALEKGQIPNQQGLFGNTKTVELIYDWEKYRINVSLVGKNTKFGSEQYVLTLNGTTAAVTLRRLNDDGVLILFNEKSYVVYLKEENDRYRFTINSHTVLFYKENDPTKIRASTSGKLIKYLVPDNGKVTQGKAFAEVEVMKMIMPLISTGNGRLHHSLNAGSVLTEGTLIGELTLDDPSQVRIAKKSARTFTFHSNNITTGSHANTVSGSLSGSNGMSNHYDVYLANKWAVNEKEKSVKNNAVVAECSDAITQILNGYGVDEPLFSDVLQTILKKLFLSLSDAKVPLYEMQEVLSSLSGRIPDKVARDIHSVLDEYARTLNSMFCSFPSQRLLEIIDGYANKTFGLRGLLKVAEYSDYIVSMQPVMDIVLRYQSGLKGCLKLLCSEFIQKYLQVESLFNAGDELEKTFEEIILNLRKSVTNEQLFQIVKSRRNIESKNKVILRLLDVIKESFLHSLTDNKVTQTSSLGDLLQGLSLLTKKENAEVAIKAKQILIQSSLPSFKKRCLEMEIFIQNAIEKVGEISQNELRDLVAQCGANFDVLTHFFQHNNEFIQAAALEVYIRRTYHAYSIENIRHDVIYPFSTNSDDEDNLHDDNNDYNGLSDNEVILPSRIVEWRFNLPEDNPKLQHVRRIQAKSLEVNPDLAKSASRIQLLAQNSIQLNTISQHSSLKSIMTPSIDNYNNNSNARGYSDSNLIKSDTILHQESPATNKSRRASVTSMIPSITPNVGNDYSSRVHNPSLAGAVKEYFLNTTPDSSLIMDNQVGTLKSGISTNDVIRPTLTALDDGAFNNEKSYLTISTISSSYSRKGSTVFPRLSSVAKQSNKSRPTSLLLTNAYTPITSVVNSNPSKSKQACSSTIISGQDIAQNDDELSGLNENIHSRVGVLAHAGTLSRAIELLPALLSRFPTSYSKRSSHSSKIDSVGESMNVLMIAIQGDSNLTDETTTSLLYDSVQMYARELCDRDIRRVTFLVIQHEAFPKFFTYRRILDYSEDLILRHLEPALAYQLELYRLANYRVEYIPTHNQDIHLYFCEADVGSGAAGPAPKDRRFFIREIIRHADLISRQSSVDYFLNEGERVMLECMNELEVVLEDNKYAQTDCNTLFLNFTPRVQLDVGQMAGAVRQLICRNASRLVRNRITVAEIRLQAELPTVSAASPINSGNGTVNPATPSSPGPVSSTFLRLVVQTDTGYSVQFHCYKETFNADLNQLVYESLPEFYGPNELGPMEGLPISHAYPTRTPLEMKRFTAQQHKTTYVYDYPALFKQATEELWRNTCRKNNTMTSIAASGVRSKITTPYFSYEELVLCSEDLPGHLSVVKTSEVKEKLGLMHSDEKTINKHRMVCGMVAFVFTAQTSECPNGRRFVVISNDLTYQIGSFGPNEDKLFFLASRFCRAHGLPRIYISANSGARIGLAQEVMNVFQVAWKDPSAKEKGFDYLYLTEPDYKSMCNSQNINASVNATRLVTDSGEVHYKLDDIVGKMDGLNVENLHYSGLIAGETSAAYEDIFTISLVSARSVGIGAYLVRLGQRTIQVDGSAIILTGAAALNKVLGSTIYTSNQQLGGPQIMAPNGISHLVVKNDYAGVLEIMRWLGYVPEVSQNGRYHCSGTPIVPLVTSIGSGRSLFEQIPEALVGIDGIDGIDSDCGDWRTEELAVALSPSAVIESLFDEGSFVPVLSAWAPSVIVGRGRLGGLPVGIVATEVGIVETTQPADPANPETQQHIVKQAGQVWYPDSAAKTAQFIEDANRENLPLVILANWRGFSGGMRDMFNEILKFGSRIVDALRTYKQPIMVVIPPHAELRGGAWVVLDPAINPSKMDMYVDKSARGGILEPEGTMEIKFRAAQLNKLIARTTHGAHGAQSTDISQSKKLLIDANTRSAYRQVALHFADLHDTPGRMMAKGCITGILDWKTARSTLYWRLSRRLSECKYESIINSELGGTNIEETTVLIQLCTWFLDMHPNATPEDYQTNNKMVAQWFTTNTQEINLRVQSYIQTTTTESLIASYQRNLSPEMQQYFLTQINASSTPQ